MNAKETLAQIKELGLLRAGNLQEKLNAMAVSFEEELIELRGKCGALQLSHDNIINSLGIKGDGPWSKLVIEYVMGLVAENVALMDSVEHAAGCISAAEAEGLVEALHETSDERLAGLVHRRLCHAHLEVKTPATDAAIAEVSAKAVEEFASSVGAEAVGLSPSSKEYKSIKSTAFRAVKFAASLRAGRKG